MKTNIASWLVLRLRTNKLRVGFKLIAFVALMLPGIHVFAQTCPLRPAPPVSTQRPTTATRSASIGTLQPGPTGLVREDNGTDNLGASVYSTGNEDVIVKILPCLSGFNNDVYLLSPGPERAIASNRANGRVVNLGKLPAGEIVFGVRTPEKKLFQVGDGTRNPDGLPHAFVKTFKSGVLQVRFEDLSGPKGRRSDRDFNDAVFQLSGGVADNSAVADLLKMIKEQKGETRAAAITALKKINPRAAANAGFR